MRKPQSRDWGFVVYGIPAVKYLESSTAKPVFKNATNVAFFRLSTPEALRGCRLTRSRGVESQDANSFALLAVTQGLSNPELCEGYEGSQ